MRLVFFGTSDFAVASLRALVRSDRRPELVVTRPDARQGRGRRERASPVGGSADTEGLLLHKPTDVNAPASLDRLRAASADLFVVVAYGQKLSRELLSIPPSGTINVHASLLPMYRGASPIHRAILDGETETGVSILEVVEKMDAGDVLARRSTSIAEEETTGELHDRLAVLGGDLLVEVIDVLESGSVIRERQDPARVTWARRLTKEDGHLAFDRSSCRVVDFVRAMTPWPGAWCSCPGENNARLVLLRVRVLTETVRERPGTLVVDGDRLRVATADGAIEILDLKKEGKRAMTAAEFTRGHRFETRQILE